MSDSLFTRDRAGKTALCTVLSAIFHAAIYGWFFNSLSPKIAAMTIDALVAGTFFFGFGWIITRSLDRLDGDWAECAGGLSFSMSFLFSGTIVALLAGALCGLVSSPFALISGFWARVGLSGLWFFASMFCMGVINRAEIRTPRRRSSQRCGGDLTIRAWGRL